MCKVKNKMMETGDDALALVFFADHGCVYFNLYYNTLPFSICNNFVLTLSLLVLTFQFILALLTLPTAHVYLQPSCDINARTTVRLTSLHIAAHEGHIKVVERLVGFGADLNITTDEGNTPLHIALGRNNMTPPTEESPRIKAVRLTCLKTNFSVKLYITTILSIENLGTFLS